MDFTRSEAEAEAPGWPPRCSAHPAGMAAAAGGDAAADLDGRCGRSSARPGCCRWRFRPSSAARTSASWPPPRSADRGRPARRARIPALATLALGVLPVARWADRELQRRCWPGSAAGETILTAAIREPSRADAGGAGDHRELTGRAEGRHVSGVKVGVPYAAAARWILVPASTARRHRSSRSSSPDADGLPCQRTRSSSGLPEYTLRLDRGPILHVLGRLQRRASPACTSSRWRARARRRRRAGRRAGAHDRAHRAREQFGRPLATFQAVAQQIADVYAAARTLHLATVSACWQLDTGRDAGRDVDVAAYWLAEHGASRAADLPSPARRARAWT